MIHEGPFSSYAHTIICLFALCNDIMSDEEKPRLGRDGETAKAAINLSIDRELKEKLSQIMPSGVISGLINEYLKQLVSIIQNPTVIGTINTHVQPAQLVVPSTRIYAEVIGRADNQGLNHVVIPLGVVIQGEGKRDIGGVIRGIVTGTLIHEPAL